MARRKATKKPSKVSPAAVYVWTDEKEDDLIDLYEENEVLYNLQHPRYYDSQFKEKVLQDIAKVLQVPGKYVLNDSR